MAAYSFDKKTENDRYTVAVSTIDRYGYFQNNITGTEGGLWFERLEGGVLALVDYDGVFELPREVVQTLRDMNLVVAEDF